MLEFRACNAFCLSILLYSIVDFIRCSSSSFSLVKSSICICAPARIRSRLSFRYIRAYGVHPKLGDTVWAWLATILGMCCVHPPLSQCSSFNFHSLSLKSFTPISTSSDCGCMADEKMCRTPFFSIKVLKFPDVNCRPLSLVSRVGAPCL